MQLTLKKNHNTLQVTILYVLLLTKLTAKGGGGEGGYSNVWVCQSLKDDPASQPPPLNHTQYI